MCRFKTHGGEVEGGERGDVVKCCLQTEGRGEKAGGGVIELAA